MSKKENACGVVILAQPTVEQAPAFVVHPKNGSKFVLEELQKIVGGYIEIVLLHVKPEGQKVYMILNEEGKLHSLPLNAIATSIYQQSRGDNDTIVGNVVITTAID